MQQISLETTVYPTRGQARRAHSDSLTATEVRDLIRERFGFEPAGWEIGNIAKEYGIQTVNFWKSDGSGHKKPGHFYYRNDVDLYAWFALRIMTHRNSQYRKYGNPEPHVISEEALTKLASVSDAIAERGKTLVAGKLRELESFYRDDPMDQDICIIKYRSMRAVLMIPTTSSLYDF